MADLVPWLVTAGTDTVAEAVDDDDSGCNGDDKDAARGGEAAVAVCLDVVWTESKPER